MRHAVIMAGGAGTRLWPLSRKQRPKHFLNLFEGKSLIRRSFERLSAFLPAEAINIITSADHIDLVAQELPEIPRDNLIGEPAVRDTANAVGLSAFLLHERDPGGVMGIFTADHIIEPIEHYKAALETAYTVAADHPDALVTLGIKPTEPHTAYGYVLRGEPLGNAAYEVNEFKEKPDFETAKKYVDSGQYYWNSGMFVWRIETILGQFEQHLPENHSLLSEIARAKSPAERTAVIQRIYPLLPKISIDYGVLEKASRVIVCEMDCNWLDVGSWTSLEEVLGTDADGQVMAASNVVTIDCKNNIFVSEDDHLLAAIGLEDIVIVRSADATLVCRKQDVQRIKDLVGKLADKHR